MRKIQNHKKQCETNQKKLNLNPLNLLYFKLRNGNNDM